MKKIKISFSGFWQDFNEKDNLFYNILRERYDVEVVPFEKVSRAGSEYLICSPLMDAYAFTDYSGVRICYSAEPFSADYNAFDYVIDFDDYSFGDRHMRYPYYLYRNSGAGTKRKSLNREEAEQILEQKEYFCNFIYGHKTIDGNRERVLEAVSSYKPVHSIGRYLNNMPHGETATRGAKGTKNEYLRKSKFTIAAESMCQDDFTTEKIKEPFDNYSIPIYYGNKKIEKEFNPAAFVNLNDFPTFEEGVEQIKAINQDDERYIQMLMQPEFVDQEYPEKKYEELKAFLYHIFDQEPEAAIRRNRYYICESYMVMQRYLRLHMKHWFLGRVFDRYFKKEKNKLRK